MFGHSYFGSSYFGASYFGPAIPSAVVPLTTTGAQTRTFELQVYRNGNWVDVPVQSAQGQINKNQAGQLSLVIPNNDSDSYRSRLYEGEKVRAYRGIIGQPSVRTWTGFVDAPTVTDSGGVSRTPVVTDYIKELNDSILLTGVVYDTVRPNQAAADVIQQAINTGQLVLTDDVGNPISTTASFSSPTGNNLCYFPDYVNPDGSFLTLASGQLGSFTSGNNQIASFSVPAPASGAAYAAFELPQRYLIASTVVMYGLTIAGSASALPPASGQVILDYYNGIFYFNPADASTTASFSAFYYNAPLWAYAPGAACADVISAIFDGNGARWSVDANGKFYASYIDTTRAPSKVLGRSQYEQLEVQSNRDRRNVIICEGWDGNCGQLFTAKCINWDDINNPPPKGLGKRAYMIIQDPTWQTRASINNAVYYAAQQVGRRGKVIAATIVDDPSIGLENVLCFSGAKADVTEGDFFYTEGIQWQYTLDKGGAFKAIQNVTGTSLPGQGTFYIGPASAVTGSGSFDFTNDIKPMSNGALSPAGGLFSSTFSIAVGLDLNYTALENGFEAIDIYGSDGSHLGPYQTTRTIGPVSVILPASSMTAGVWYVVKLRFEDALGNIGIYRDFIQAEP